MFDLELYGPCHPQAFSIPVIQIVYETLKDQQEGKKGRASIKTGGASETILLYVTLLLSISAEEDMIIPVVPKIIVQHPFL